MGIFSIGIGHAQVGINTQNPQGVFHVDGKGNTNGTNNVSDDFVINANGNVGIGTTTPQAKLDIIGSMIVNDGTAAKDRILTSDNQGNATWQEFDRSQGISIWKGSATNITFSAITPIIDATHSVSDPMGMNFATSNSSDKKALLSIPAGTYIIIIDFDINVQEYGAMNIVDYATNSNIFTVYYIEQLTGASFMYKFTKTTQIYLSGNYRNTPGLTRYALYPYNSKNVSFTLTFISVTK